MLFLLRQIRRKLLTDNKVMTYLLYAIGEIILVVVGILIAVSIDNWNQNRKDQQAERHYLTSLLSDLQLQMREAELGIKSESSSAILIREIGEQFENGFKDTDGALLNVKLTKSMISRSLNQYNATFEELNATGNIGLISNEELKMNIIAYYQSLDRSSLVLQKYEDQMINTLSGQLIESGLLNFDIRFDLINVDLGRKYLSRSGESINNPVSDSLAVYDFERMNLDKLKSPEGAYKLKNILTARYFSTLVALVNFNQIKEDTKNLKTAIEIDLNKK
jgi:hypothetical protein